MIEFIFLLLIFSIILQVLLWTIIVQIEQYQAGVVFNQGKYESILNPGWNFVNPIAKITKVDLRMQYLDFPTRSFETNDSHSVNLAATLSYSITDVKKSVLQDTLSSSELNTRNLFLQAAPGKTHDEKTKNKISKIIEVTLRDFISKNDKSSILSDNFDDSQLIERIALQVRDLGVTIDNIEILQLENKIEFEEKKQVLREIESQIIRPIYPSILKFFPFVVINPSEWGISLVTGKFSEVLTADEPDFDAVYDEMGYKTPVSARSALRFTFPFVSEVYILDKELQTLTTPKQEVITKDRTRTNLEATVNYKITNPTKALLAVSNYKAAMIHIVHSSIREYASLTSLYDLIDSEDYNSKFGKILNKNLEGIGIEIDDFSKIEIKEIGSSYFVNTTYANELPVSALTEEQIKMENFYNNSIVFGGGFWNLLRNLFTQRSLRFYFGLGFFGSASSHLRKSSSTLYALFTLFYLAISVIWAAALIYANIFVSEQEYDIALQVARDNGGTIDSNYFYYVFAAGLCIIYLFLYLPFMFFLHWPHSYWTKKAFDESLIQLDNQVFAEQERIKQNTTVAGTLKELYMIRSEILKYQEQGMAIGNLLDEVEVLENKFVGEAKQNVSIEEIGKLQEEFISGLGLENSS